MPRRSPARIALAAVLAAGTLAPAAAAQSPELRGRVTEAHDARAKVTLDSDRAPAAGSPAEVYEIVDDLGELPVAGTWSVTEIGDGFVWIEAAGDVTTPVPGQYAKIRPSETVVWPSTEEEGAGGTDGGILVFRDDFGAGSVWTEAGGSCPRTREAGALVMRNQRDEGHRCDWVPGGVGALEGSYRATLGLTLRDGPMDQGYGLMFGARWDPSDFFLFQVSGRGSFRLMHSTPDRWRGLTPWTPHEAVRPAGNRNALSATVAGRTAVLAVNGQEVGRATLPRAGDGEIGLYVNSRGMEVAVDETTVHQLAAPPGREPAPGGRLVTSRRFEVEMEPPRWGACHPEVRDGELHLTNVSDAGTFCFWTEQISRMAGRYRVTAKVRLVEGPVGEPFGLVFGAGGDRESFYLFEIFANRTYRLMLRRDDEWRGLLRWTRRAEIRGGLGATNELSLEVEGRRVHLFVNGSFLRTVELPDEPVGAIGYYVDEGGQTAAFDDVVLEELPDRSRH